MSAGGFDQQQLADRDPDSVTASVHDMGLLARSHEDITILFMDIVGEPRRRAKCCIVNIKVAPGSPVPNTAASCRPRFHFHVKASATGCCHEFPQLVRVLKK